MKLSMGSPTISNKAEGERKLSLVENGDVVNVQRFTHVFGDPPAGEGLPQISRGSIPMKVTGKRVYHFVFIGCGKLGETLSPQDLEKRMNDLGWYRREGS